MFELTRSIFLLHQLDSFDTTSWPGTDAMIQAAFTVRHSFAAYVVVSQIKQYIFTNDENISAGAAFLAIGNNSEKVNFNRFIPGLLFFNIK